MCSIADYAALFLFISFGVLILAFAAVVIESEFRD